MVLRRLCRKAADSLKTSKRGTGSRRLRKPRRHAADTPPADGRCLLLDLPVEIRCRILKYTLCHDEPIQAREYHKRADNDAPHISYMEKVFKFDEWPHGKPSLSVLRSCRQLYQEGSDIFYHKNTFGITICDSGYGLDSHTDMLGMGHPITAFELNPRLKRCPNLKLSVMLADMVSCTGLGYNGNKEALDAIFDGVWKYWQGCGRLEVDVQQRSRQWASADMGGASFLHKLGLFRCKYVALRGVPYSVSSILTQLIESGRPVIDLQQAFRELGTYLEATRRREDPYNSGFGDAYSDAERFAAFHQLEEFMLLRKEVVEEALQRMDAECKRVRERGHLLMDEVIPIRIKDPLAI